MGVGFARRLAIPEVNEEPLKDPLFVLHVLELVSISITIERCVGVSREMEYSSFGLANPHTQVSVSEVSHVVLNVRGIHGEPECYVPRVLWREGSPFEPTTN